MTASSIALSIYCLLDWVFSQLRLDKGRVERLILRRKVRSCLLRPSNHEVHGGIGVFYFYDNAWVLVLENAKDLVRKALSQFFHLIEIENDF